MSTSQRASDADWHVTLALWVLGGVCLAGLLTWLSAVLAVGLSGDHWRGTDLASAGTFFAELVTGSTPTAAWHAATGIARFAPEWLFWLIQVLLVASVGGLASLVQHRLRRGEGTTQRRQVGEPARREGDGGARRPLEATAPHRGGTEQS